MEGSEIKAKESRSRNAFLRLPFPNFSSELGRTGIHGLAVIVTVIREYEHVTVEELPVKDVRSSKRSACQKSARSAKNGRNGLTGQITERIKSDIPPGVHRRMWPQWIWDSGENKENPRDMVRYSM
ncbi:unnamed protein product [Caenorhabditis sp. 36 PRJEB53466]|nr:unnamed protein product [Caenorhabditis sp. 36 PRJEB53466]